MDITYSWSQTKLNRKSARFERTCCKVSTRRLVIAIHVTAVRLVREEKKVGIEIYIAAGKNRAKKLSSVNDIDEAILKVSNKQT